MPNITQYEAGDRGPEPTDAAASAAREAGFTEDRFIRQGVDAIGGAISKVGGKIGDIVDQHMAMQEISHGSASLATLADGLTSSWNQTVKTADPNDQSIYQGFNEKTLNPALDNFSEQFQTGAGKKWALEQSDSFRQRMTTNMRADMATQSAVAAGQNMQTVVDRTSNLARQDPSSEDFAHNLLNSTADAILQASPNMSADDAARFRNEYINKGHSDIAIAAIDGKADVNPEATIADLQAGKHDQYLTGEQVGVAQKYAEAVIKNRQEQQRAAQADQDRQDEKVVQQAAGQIVQPLIQPDGSLHVTPQAVADAGKLMLAPKGYELGRAMLQSFHTANKEQTEGVLNPTDPQTYAAFNTRMLSPDPNALTDHDIYAAHAAGQLSDKDMTFFLGARAKLAADPGRKAAEKDFANFSTGQKPAFTHGSGFSLDPATGQVTGGSADPIGAQNYTNFYRAAQQQYDAAYARDPKEAAAMLDSKSPSYLGRLAPSYLANKKSADFNSGGTGLKTAPNQLTAKQVDGYVADPKNQGKFFTVEGEPGKRYGPIPKLPAQ